MQKNCDKNVTFKASRDAKEVYRGDNEKAPLVVFYYFYIFTLSDLILIKNLRWCLVENWSEASGISI